MQETTQPRKDKKTLVITLIIIVVLLVVAFFALLYFKVGTKTLSSDAYQAVFLSNGQVYFGHLKDTQSKFPVLTSIYYLQLKKPLQEQKKEDGTEKESELVLVKLGQELHGPQDEMVINKDHILFVEELKEDSKVVKAIKDYEAKK